MDRFHEMQVFLAVADEEGFAAAARRLKTSPPSVTRAIAAMEERIGTQLLARTTRSLHLTEALRNPDDYPTIIQRRVPRQLKYVFDALAQGGDLGVLQRQVEL